MHVPQFTLNKCFSFLFEIEIENFSIYPLLRTKINDERVAKPPLHL